MSVVAQSPPYIPFRDAPADVFAPSGAVTSRAEFPPVLDSPQLRLSFPVFQHRHSSPYPMSFSALGAPRDSALHAVQPPAAPKPPSAPLPQLATKLPILPSHSPPANTKPTVGESRRKHFPDMMVKLAAPADDGYEVVHEIRLDGERGMETPRRSPSVGLDLGLAGMGQRSGQEMMLGRSNSEGKSRKKELEHMAKRKSMGPPSRPMRAQTSYPSSTASSVRMEPSRSADNRAKLRAAMPQRAQSFSPHSTASDSSRPSADHITPPRHVASASADAETQDLGGPDGLEAKVVLLGSQGVGKTSLILRYTTRTFAATPAPATVGSSFYTRKLVHSGVRVKLQIWDTAGQERFRSMAPIYYRGAHVCVLVYDTSDRQSFEDVRSWLDELGRTVPKDTVIFVVGAKIDLETKRAVSLSEARRYIKVWTRPPPPPSADLLSPPSKPAHRSASPTPRSDLQGSQTPARSYSHGALAAFEYPLPSSTASSTAPTPARQLPPSVVPSKSSLKPATATSGRPPPALKIVTSSPRAERRVAFPTLQSPTGSVTGTTAEHVNSSITPSSPTRHGMSAGRFSISGVLGLSRTESMSGAAASLARLAEDFPRDPKRANQDSRSPPPIPTRVRTESSPLLSGLQPVSGRRRSEDWSSRSWRMGEGPGAAEALGEFGASIRRKESEELLGGSSGSNSSALSGSLGNLGEQGVHGQRKVNRSRGGSLGRDSRLYPSSEDEEESEWGIEVGNVRLGECSALTGEGVEALFRAISSLLVQKKDKIERERVLRRKNSVMLVDPSNDGAAQTAAKGRYGCCA